MDILEACNRLERAGLIAGTSGNVSIRQYAQSGEQIWTTPTTRLKGLLGEEALVGLSLDGEKLDPGSANPSSEIAMHLEIYRAIPWANAVVHAHPITASALATSCELLDFCVTAEGAASVGPVARIDYITPGTEALARACARAVATGARVVLMRYHGAVCAGESLEEATARMESLEHVARVVAQMKALGELPLLPRDEVERLRQKVGLGFGLPREVFDVE